MAEPSALLEVNPSENENEKDSGPEPQPGPSRPPREEVAEQEEAAPEDLFLEFLRLMQHLPDDLAEKVPDHDLANHLDLISTVLYGGDDKDKKYVEMIRKNDQLAERVWAFISTGTKLIFRSVINRRKKLQNTRRPVIEVERLLKDRRPDIKAATAAVTNFLQAEISQIPTEAYVTLVEEAFKEAWETGILDEIADCVYTPLENLTRDKARAQVLVEKGAVNVKSIVERLNNFSLDSPMYESMVWCVVNLCQVSSIVKIILTDHLENDPDVLLEHLLQAVKPTNPGRIRLAISCIFRNMSMFLEHQELLLNQDLDFLSYAILPVVGRGEYTDDEMMQFPLSVYGTLLDGENVERDCKKEIRSNALECLYQLCSTKESREILRQLNIYCILREYHKWEKDDELLELTERVVNLLIQTEEEIGVDNLRNLKISDDADKDK